MLPSYRTTNFIGFLSAIGLLSFAGYLQFYLKLPPCPLCIMQRIFMAFIAVLLIFGAIHKPLPFAKKLINFFLILSAIGGLLTAGRQVWLQHLPADKVPACGPGLNYLLANFPLTDAIKAILIGTGECAQVVWKFLGLSIPEWTLLFFILFMMLGLIQFQRK